VGAGYITDSDKEYFSLVASADDPTTTAKDGFLKGNRISMRIWKADQGKEISDIKIVFADGYANYFEPEGTTIADVSIVSSGMDNITWLGEAYPNPFSSETTIPYSLGRELHVSISIYNMMGQKITSLVDATLTPDQYSVTWNGFNQKDQRCEPGVYLCRFETNDMVLIKRIELIK
jgi:hypothetical protein